MNRKHRSYEKIDTDGTLDPVGIKKSKREEKD